MKRSELKDTLILIGGASGVGKTRLASELDAQGTAVYRKLHEVTLEIAKGMGMDPISAIAQMEDSVVIERMIELAREYYCVVTDVHYAIQPITDTGILVDGNAPDAELAKTEKYIPALKVSDLKLVSDGDINLLPIILTCDTDCLLQRRLKNTDRIPRSTSKHEIDMERESEMMFYLSTMSQLGLTPNIFMNGEGQFDNLKRAVSEFIKSHR